MLSWLAIGILAALAAWSLAGLVLRLAGALLAIGGLLVTAVSGSPAGALAAIIGCLVWLAGHWLYGLRHHAYASPLARRIFTQLLPRQLDPARRWGIRTTTASRR